MMTMRNFLHQDLDESLALGGNEHFDPAELLETQRLFQDGEKVYAMFAEDGLFYEAAVVNQADHSSYLVIFEGYNNEQITAAENIRSVADVEKERAAAEAAAETPVTPPIERKGELYLRLLFLLIFSFCVCCRGKQQRPCGRD
jgi:hypothetical protein